MTTPIPAGSLAKFPGTLGFFTCQSCGMLHKRWRTHSLHVLTHSDISEGR